MSGVKKQPALRFAGFAKEWEERKLGELIEDYIERTEVQNQYPVLTSSQQQGIVLQESYFADRQVTTNDNIGYFVLPKGYFTYRSRSDTNIFVFNRNDIIDKGIISYYYPVFMVKYTDSDFLLRRLNHGIRKQLAMAAEGTGQKVLAHSKFKNMTVSTPMIAEQSLIGTFFRNLDTLITLHQHKHDVFVNVKKSMLEKMFPKEGARVPEMRFAGFSGEWEERKLGDITEFLPNNTFSRANLSQQGIIQNIHYGDILTKFGELIDISKIKLPFIVEKNNNRIDEFKLQDGDIIFADAAEDKTVGKCTEVHKIYNKIVFSGLHTIPCRPQIHFATAYLGYFFNSPCYHTQLLPFMQGIKVLSVSKTTLRQTSIVYPKNLAEQTLIGTLFRNLDTLITLHQRKLTILKNLKKACLEKMFV